MARKIHRGDTVFVANGKDRGKQGEVQRMDPKKNRVLVAGVNLTRRHQRSRPGVRQAGIISFEVPVHVSNVQLICPQCNRAVRVGFTFLEDGRKVRICKKCHETIT
jgi:large subunit ribosomal protein L24